MTANTLNIDRFAEAYARALTVQFQKKYPGIKITPKKIIPKEGDHND